MAEITSYAEQITIRGFTKGSKTTSIHIEVVSYRLTEDGDVLKTITDERLGVGDTILVSNGDQQDRLREYINEDNKR